MIQDIASFILRKSRRFVRRMSWMITIAAVVIPSEFSAPIQDFLEQVILDENQQAFRVDLPLWDALESQETQKLSSWAF